LQQQGDNANNPRKIDHLALLPSAGAQTTFADYVRSEGFDIAGVLGEPSADGQFGVEFSRVDQPAQIDEIVEPLFLKANELGGVYDGWGCPVSP
jgi:hypothetical protein